MAAKDPGLSGTKELKWRWRSCGQPSIMGPVQHTYRYHNKDKDPHLRGLLDDPMCLVDNIYVWRTQKKLLWPLIVFFFLINFLLFHFVAPIPPFPFTYTFLHCIYFIIFQEIIFLFPSYFYFLCFYISTTTPQSFSCLCFFVFHLITSTILYFSLFYNYFWFILFLFNQNPCFHF